LKKWIRYRIAKKMLREPSSSLTFAKMFSRMVSSFSALKMSADWESFCVCSRISSSSAFVKD
jgi:hypothetical protein